MGSCLCNYFFSAACHYVFPRVVESCEVVHLNCLCLRRAILCFSGLLSFEKVGCGGVDVNCLCLRRAILCFSGLLSFEKVGCGGVDVNCVCLRRGIFVFLRVVEF